MDPAGEWYDMVGWHKIWQGGVNSIASFGALVSGIGIGMALEYLLLQWERLMDGPGLWYGIIYSLLSSLLGAHVILEVVMILGRIHRESRATGQLPGRKDAKRDDSAAGTRLTQGLGSSLGASCDADGLHSCN